MGDYPGRPHSSEFEKSSEERVRAFINTLYFELPENTKEKASGKHLLEISDMRISKIKPPLESEGRITILPGQVLALTGPNGTGKSTFFKSFLEGQLPDGIKHKPGLKVGYLPQEGNFEEVADLTLEEFLEEMSQQVREANEWDFEDDLFATGQNILFKDALKTRVGDLSGGEKTKLQMLILLLRKAELIFLDEPTNHLDLEGQVLLTKLIQSLKERGETQDTKTSFVISSHNQEFLQNNSQDGQLSISVEGEKRAIRQKRKYSPEAAKKAKYRIPWLTQVSFTNQQEFYSGGYAEIAGHRQYFSPVYAGKKIILAGENGSGKTSFLNYLTNPNDRKVTGTTPEYLPQEWPKEIQQGTVGDFLAYLRVDDYNFTKTLAESGFLERRPKDTNWLVEKFSSFSLGEQKFLWFLAVCGGNSSSFLLLDEPTNHLDVELKAELIEAILNFSGTVLAVTHDKDLMNAIISKTDLPKQEFWLMQRGKDTKYDSAGIGYYFEQMERKAKQSVSQLGL